MNGTLKFVVVMLVLAALASPSLALTACGSRADAAGMKCPPDCPMMARCAQARMAGAAAAGGLCCHMSSGKPAPATVAQLPVSPAQARPMVSDAAPHMPLLAQPREAKAAREVPAVDTSPQAILCTFLI
jgi:hypothetical protein